MDKNYVNRTITDHESLVLNFGYHWTHFINRRHAVMALLPHGVGLAALALNAVIAGSFGLLVWWAFIPTVIVWGVAIRTWWAIITSSVRIVTSRRIIYKTGFLSRSTNEIKLSAIEAITIDQGILGRMLRVGTLNIIGRGDGNRLRFIAVTRPIRTKHIIENIDWQEPITNNQTG